MFSRKANASKGEVLGATIFFKRKVSYKGKILYVEVIIFHIVADLSYVLPSLQPHSLGNNPASFIFKIHHKNCANVTSETCVLLLFLSGNTYY